MTGFQDYKSILKSCHPVQVLQSFPLGNLSGSWRRRAFPRVPAARMRLAKGALCKSLEV